MATLPLHNPARRSAPPVSIQQPAVSVSGHPRLLLVDAAGVTRSDPAELERHPAVSDFVARGARVRTVEPRLTNDGAQMMVVLSYASDDPTAS